MQRKYSVENNLIRNENEYLLIKSNEINFLSNEI